MESMRITRTSKSGLIRKEEVYLRKLNHSYAVYGNGYEIPIEKLYHPMTEYWSNPTLFNKVWCEINILMYKYKMMRIAYRKGTDVHHDKYGVYLTRPEGDYYFQFREKDYNKLIKL